MNYAEIKERDITNGEGVRVSLFVTGCEHNCKGCFNKSIWDFDKGKEFTPKTLDKILLLLKEKYIQGFSLLGGEPLHPSNINGCRDMLAKIKEKYPKKDIWVWTGYDFEEILLDRPEILQYIDILVDGKFEQYKRDLSLKFAGSTNQRIIDVKKTLRNGNVELYNV